MKGDQIQLINKNMTASRGLKGSNYQSVLGEMGFKTGRHYWEVKIDEYGTEEDIFVGVCKKDIKLNMHGIESPGTTWGWQCTSARKMWPID